ncbi:glutaminase [Tumebacillus flagellatus]|uniref:Glutaminase n=1 Tax=Tumebacillus flagellatus TaxID=1157490 RepID=A0A074LLW6_9BACL|nr:glutaminase [Tumebacillus flagellatus]KEO80893.1 glutaminase [Tumebacillus flagellatus]
MDSSAAPEHQNAAASVQRWLEQFRSCASQGQLATYIPALADNNPTDLGICLIGREGQTIRAGEWNTPFTLQSVSKVISFLVACITRGVPYVLDRVDVEPTGDPFNSIIRLETNKPGKPFNPMINAGAITVASMLPGDTVEEKVEHILHLLERFVGKRLAINEDVFESEWGTAHRNRSLAYYLKAIGYLEADVEVALEVYLKQCAIEVTAEDLAQIGLVLSCDGIHPWTHEQIIPVEVAKMTKALMLTCGMYNASGKFAAFVGLPAKSGVAGGILVTVPPRVADQDLPFLSGCGIGIYGPSIDECGNSVAGVKLLKHISREWKMSIF